MGTQAEATLKSLRQRAHATEDPQVESFKVHAANLTQVTAGELKLAMDANPEHPLCEDWKRNRDLPDAEVLYVERVDLAALLDNRQVVRTEAVEKVRGRNHRVVRKALGDSLSDSPTPPSPALKPEPAKSAPAPAPKTK